MATVPTGGAQLPEPEGVATPAPSAPTRKLPPLDVPSDVSEAARTHFESLAQDVPAIHAELDAAAEALSTPCPIDRAACDAHWKSIATQLAKADDALANLGPRCPGTSDDAKRFEERLVAHANVIRGRIESLERRSDEQIASEAAKRRWQEHRDAAAIPRPCLRYACEDW